MNSRTYHGAVFHGSRWLAVSIDVWPLLWFDWANWQWKMVQLYSDGYEICWRDVCRGDATVHCDLCSQWLHIRCNSATSKLYQAIKGETCPLISLTRASCRLEVLTTDTSILHSWNDIPGIIEDPDDTPEFNIMCVPSDCRSSTTRFYTIIN